MIPFLCDSAFYPHNPETVQLIQTHASFVFLAPPFVYKLKKPVDFGFLDFSTLAKRRHFCQREVELNRRLTRDVYLEVVPISKVDGGFRLGDGEEIVEYAVKMRLLSEEGFLDQRLVRDEVGESDLNRIVETLTGFYQSQHPTSEIEERGRIPALRISTDENFRQTREFAGRTLSWAAYRALSAYTERYFLDHEELFQQRVGEGRILDCHGDLHLEHIHLTPEALNIYDCIEFNDRFRYVDIASDAAFLAMDLDFRSRPDLSRYFVARLAEKLCDPGMLKLMDFYKSYRAYVRGKVESLHSVAHAAPPGEQEASVELARRYFRLALRYAVAGSEPLVLVIMGRIGSGKSTLAGALAEELGWQLSSSDLLRKNLAGVPLHERGTPADRENLYAPEMSERTYSSLVRSAEESVEGGRSIVLDATFGRRRDRDGLRRRLDQRGTAYCFLEVQADDETVRRRLARREEEPEVLSDARLEDFPALNAGYEAPIELSSDCFGEIDANSPEKEAVSAALQFLGARQVSRP